MLETELWIHIESNWINQQTNQLIKSGLEFKDGSNVGSICYKITELRTEDTNEN